MSNIIRIIDFTAHELDIYARLSENDLLSRHKPEEGIFIAESPNVIERALNAGCVPISVLIDTIIIFIYIICKKCNKKKKVSYTFSSISLLFKF